MWTARSRTHSDISTAKQVTSQNFVNPKRQNRNKHSSTRWLRIKPRMRYPLRTPFFLILSALTILSTQFTSPLMAMTFQWKQTSGLLSVWFPIVSFSIWLTKTQHLSNQAPYIHQNCSWADSWKFHWTTCCQVYSRMLPRNSGDKKSSMTRSLYAAPLQKLIRDIKNFD